MTISGNQHQGTGGLGSAGLEIDTPKIFGGVAVFAQLTLVVVVGGGRTWSQSFSSASKRELGFSNGAHGLRHSYAQDRMNALQRSGVQYDQAKRGVMVGYPLGELAGCRFVIDKASKEALRKSSALTLDSFIGECHAKNIVKESKSLFTDLPKLQEEVVAARKKILTMNLSATENMRNFLVVAMTIGHGSKKLTVWQSNATRIRGRS